MSLLIDEAEVNGMTGPKVFLDGIFSGDRRRGLSKMQQGKNVLSRSLNFGAVASTLEP